MLASVIIDNYNYGRFLREAIDSALAQIYPNVEVIVVDDGSTDDSRAIIASYGNRIRPVLKANGGQASAFNAGFAVSRGDIVFFLDSDDTLSPAAVQNAVALFDDPAVVKVHWPLRVVNEQGQDEGRIFPPRPLPEGDLREVVLCGGPTSCASSPTSGNAWARAFLEKVLPMPEDVAYYKTCADEYLFTLAPVFGRIKTLQQPQGTYRIHGKNIYAARSFVEKLPLELAGHEQQCAALSRVLKNLGIAVDLTAWQRNSWFHRLQKAIDEINGLLAVDDQFILIDDGTWGANDIFPRHRARPLLEKSGEDWGPPADDASAIAAVKEHREAGARFIAFAWPAFWWLEHYKEFHRWLGSEFHCALKNERLVVYDLQQRLAKPPPYPAGVTVSAKAAPLVSIVINNYNYGHFLKETIDSALNQTYPRVEVIVVDDGSTDRSREVIASFGKRVIPIFKENGGQASTYNSGFQASHGEIVCYLDADDTLYPRAIETAVRLFDSSVVVKAQWPLAVTDKTGRPTGELSTKEKPPDGDLREQITQEGPIYDFLFTTGSAYRREFLETVFPMPEPPYRNGADVYLITLAPACGLLRTAAEPLGTYRSHGSNNYRGRALDDARLKNYLDRFEINCSVLRDYLVKMGLQADCEQWKRQNFNYLWPQRLLQAKEDLTALIPSGTSYVLINQDEWGDLEPVPGRRAIPFLERDGEYFGPPPDDATAITELERLRHLGAEFIVFWWTCFWWFDQYPKFHQRLRSHFRCALENDRLLVFDLKRQKE